MRPSGKQTKSSEVLKGLAIIFSYAKDYKKELAIISLISLALAGLGAVNPYIIGKFFDALNENGNALFYIGMLAVVSAAAYVLDVALDFVRRPLGIKISTEYTKQFFARYISLPISYLKERKRGSVHASHNRARTGLIDMISFFVTDVFVELLKLIISLVIIFSIEWRLGLVLLAGLFLYQLITTLGIPGLKRYTKKRNKADSSAVSIIHEAVDNFTEVKRSHTEEFEMKRVNQAFVGRYRKVATAMQIYMVKMFGSRHFVFVTTTVVILFIGMNLVQAGSITVGTLIAVNLYAAQTFMPIRWLSNVVTRMSETSVTIYETEQMLEKIKPERRDGRSAIENMRGEIKFSGVSFYYKKKDGDVLKEVSFSVNPGERVAFVGKSGSGKSTSVDLIGGFYLPQKGNVFIDGISTKKIDLDDLRSQIAYVSQDVVLFGDTIEKNIAYGSQGSTKEQIREAARMAHCEEFIENLPKGYKTKVGERGVKLSGGQKQRIAIARAILRDPKILILDEPTSALDIESEKFISESLEELMKGRTTIIIAHRLSTVRSADNILVFKEGKIIESGTHDQLLEMSGEYERMHNLYLE